MDALKNLQDACTQFLKESKALEGNRENDAKYIKALKIQKDDAVKELEAVTAGIEKMKAQATSDYNENKQKIAKEREDFDKEKSVLRADWNILNNEKEALAKEKLAFKNEKASYDDDKVQVEKMKKDLEDKLAKHREAVEALR